MPVYYVLQLFCKSRMLEKLAYYKTEILGHLIYVKELALLFTMTEELGGEFFKLSDN